MATDNGERGLLYLLHERVRALENREPSAALTKLQQEWMARFHAEVEGPELEHSVRLSADNDNDAPHVRSAPKGRHKR